MPAIIGNLPRDFILLHYVTSSTDFSVLIASSPADANYDTLGEQSTPQHTVVQIFIHTARKMDGELETLTVSQLKKIRSNTIYL